MNFSRTTLGLFALAAMLIAGSYAARAGEAEEAAANLAKAPAAVQATAKKELGDKKLEEFDKEKVGDKVEYEAGYKENGVDHAIIIAENGDVIQHEADVEVSKLPAAVTDAIKKAHPDSKIDEAATATTPDGKEYYDVDVKVGSDTRAMDVKADGTVLSDEVSVENSSDSKDAGEGKEKGEGKEGAKDKD